MALLPPLMWGQNCPLPHCPTQHPHWVGEGATCARPASARSGPGSRRPAPDPTWALCSPESARDLPSRCPGGAAGTGTVQERRPLAVTRPDPVWGTPPEPAVPGWVGVGRSQQNLPLWAEAAGLLPAGVSQRSLCLEQTCGLVPCPRWLASPPHGAVGSRGGH